VKKKYLVTVTKTVVVEARTEAEAEQMAELTLDYFEDHATMDIQVEEADNG